MYHPDVALTYAHDRQRELVTQAEQRRLVSAIRRSSRANVAARKRPTAANPARGVGVATPA
jgi:hypothetical protein